VVPKKVEHGLITSVVSSVLFEIEVLNCELCNDHCNLLKPKLTMQCNGHITMDITVELAKLEFL